MTSQENVGNRMLAGKCLCGAVQYAVADEFIYAANCHCSDCRRTTGSAFKPFAGIERERLSLTKGEDNLLIFGDETGHNVHCKTCGSLLYSVVRDGAFVHVAMGDARRRAGHPSDAPHLCRLQGEVVHDHRRPASIRRSCHRRRRLKTWRCG